MKRRFTKQYLEARYELSVIDSKGKPVPGGCVPWRFNRVLTEEEMSEGYKTGFAKYAVKVYESVPDDEPDHGEIKIR